MKLYWNKLYIYQWYLSVIFVGLYCILRKKYCFLYRQQSVVLFTTIDSGYTPRKTHFTTHSPKNSLLLLPLPKKLKKILPKKRQESTLFCIDSDPLYSILYRQQIYSYECRMYSQFTVSTISTLYIQSATVHKQPIGSLIRHRCPAHGFSSTCPTVGLRVEREHPSSRQTHPTSWTFVFDTQ